MQRNSENSTLASVIKLLYTPVPYLPDISFLERGRVESRKRGALARIREKLPQERKVRGNLELLGKGKIRICGHIVEITETTWIFGDVQNGSIAEMTIVESGEVFAAKRIVIM